jgi:glycosyltransferase involved in cell wall biosynthesis
VVKTIAVVITGLGVGGAETFLTRLIEQLRCTYRFEVISLLPVSGQIAERLTTLGVEVHSLEMKRGIPSAKAVGRLVGLFRQIKPDLVHTWMYHANIVGGLATKKYGSIPVIWCIRHSSLSWRLNKKTTVFTAWLGAILSHFIPSQIVYCAEAARRSHEAAGYANSKTVVIPNGIETTLFQKDPIVRSRARAQLGVGSEEIVVGTIGRLDPLKGQELFVRASAEVAKARPNVTFVMAGAGIETVGGPVEAWVKVHQIAERVILLGQQPDVPTLLNGIDIYVSPSTSEGFPNVIAEAMATSLAVAATDAGDSAVILGESGYVSPVDDAPALAANVCRIIDMSPADRSALGAKLRIRIEREFDIAVVAQRFSEVFLASWSSVEKTSNGAAVGKSA